MATLRKRISKKGYIWFVDYYIAGHRRRKSTGTANRRIAEKIRQKIESDLVMKKFGIPIEKENNIKLKEFIEKYLEYSKNNKTLGTYKNIHSKLINFIEFTGNRNLENINNFDIEKFKNYLICKRISKSTCNTTLHTLKAMFNKAIEWGFVSESPLKNVKMFRTDKKLPVFFEKNEIKKFLDAINDNIHFKNYIEFLLYTGCRRNEALMVKWADIDARRKRISVLAGKTGEAREVPINDKLSDILKSMDQKGEYLFDLSVNCVNRIFRKYLKKSGIRKPATIHTLRHTFASHLMMSNKVNIYTLSKLLGHSSVKMTEIYSHLSNGFIQDSVKYLTY